ncbi:MAG: hypothetical protein QHH18_07605 [Candidatus Bathyarchaeota archaeon]|nr:hypothetical protein [Candidatus Bathyarchaeota archaeon]
MAVRMVNKKISQTVVISFMLILLGSVLIICTMPLFTYTRDESQLVPMSETLIDGYFEIYQSQNKVVTVELSIEQTLNILATSNSIFNFSIVNQTQQPNITYYFLNNTNTVNMTWTHQIRTQPRTYHLVFDAQNASLNSPVEVYANVTKNWTEVKLVPVLMPDRIPLINSNFAYIGAAILVIGIIYLRVNLRSKRKLKDKRQQRPSAIK